MELLSDKGKNVRLGRPLGRPGGEGQIWEIENTPAYVAKIYHKPAEPEKVKKLRCQLQLATPDLQNVAAWPLDVLFERGRTNEVKGIVMPRVAGKEIHILYGPSNRAAEFSNAGWDFLVHVAMNCAAAFDTLHECGIVMADVNEGNLLVRENDGRVGLIDCDSYQFRNGTGMFLCDVGIPMWTPPELQGKDFRGLQRTPNHDRFGLAILIFRLLFMGRHPFAGIPPAGYDQLEIEQAIKNCLFAFSKETWARGFRPPPFSLSMDAVPSSLKRLFDRAFLASSMAANARPSGREWATELGALLKALKKGCMDPGHKFWNGLTACPWCEIVSEGGPNFFISISLFSGSVNWTAEFTKYWGIIERLMQGTLLTDGAALPAVAKPTPNAMPVSKPQLSTVTAPVEPTKPAPPPRVVLQAPQMPRRPVQLKVKRVPRYPLAHNEKLVRIARIGLCVFGMAGVAFWLIGLTIPLVGCVWAAAVCVFANVAKGAPALAERTERKKREAEAQQVEKKRVEGEYTKQIAAYETEVEKLTKAHVLTVAKAEAEHRAAWLKQDEEYQAAYNQYLGERRAYDAIQRKYSELVGTWNREVDVRTTREGQLRQAANSAIEQLESVLADYRQKINGAFPALQAAKDRYERAKTGEISDMRELHTRRQAVQLRQFLATQLVQDADIDGIRAGRKRTLNAYGIDSALDVKPDIRVPGFGSSLIASLLNWRRECERKFRYNPNTPLPPADVNAVKIKYGQLKQTALSELRGGAVQLDSLEIKTRADVTKRRLEILQLTRSHAQAIADLSVCC